MDDRSVGRALIFVMAIMVLFAIGLVIALNVNEFWGTMMILAVMFIVIPVCGTMYAGGISGKHIPVERMTGIEFEEYCATVLKRSYDFITVKTTKVVGDYGGDLIGRHRDGSKWVIQCKRYSGTVGNSAVQEVVAAKADYGADKAAVMTNSRLTANAKKLAHENGVKVYENIR